MAKFVKLAWMLACVGVLAYVLFVCAQKTVPTLRGECVLLAAVMMAFLSFPLGILWWLLLSAAGYVLSGSNTGFSDESIIVNLVVWGGFFVVGYLQWFSFVPLLIRKIRRRKDPAL